MNKTKFLICAVIGAIALTACSMEDNPGGKPVVEPTDTTTVVIDNPQESVTDQPAFAPAR